MYSLRKVISITVAVLLPINANAALIEADFHTQAHYPDLDFIDALVVHRVQNQTIKAEGYELTGDHRIANDTGLRGGELWLDYDPASHVLTLDSRDRWDFQTLIVDIQNMRFSDNQQLQSFELLANDLFEEALDPALAFSANSLRIEFDARPSSFKFSGGQAQFQLGMKTFSVPEPSTLSLLVLSIGAALGSRRLRRQRV